MKSFKKIIALTMSLAISCAMCGALTNYAIAEESVSLEDHIKDIDTLLEAPLVDFSGNQAFVRFSLMTHVSGCVISADDMKWEVSGTAEASFNGGKLIKSLSYNNNLAEAYCIITANSPGTVTVSGTEIDAYTRSPINTIYWNFNVGEDGNFDGTVNHDKPVESTILGDVNADGEFSIADVVLFQKWLLSASNTKLANWKAADLNEDDTLDVFDLTLMRKLLLEKSGNNSNKSIEYTVLDEEWTWVKGDNFKGEIDAVSTYSEMCDIIESVDEYEHMQSALYERLSDKGVDEEFFDDNVIIVLYGSVGGSTRTVTIDEISKKQNSLTVYTTTKDNGPPSPDMRSYRMILAINSADFQGIDEVSHVDDFISYWDNMLG